MLAESPHAAPLNPFPGLRAFEADEDHLFFGRERQIDELLTRLRRTRFLSVIGASGSGKSSLVRSGLIPALYSGFMVAAGSSWRVAVMRPGPDPVGALARALNEPGILQQEELGAMGAEILETTLRRSALGLVEAVRQARLPEGENLLVLVDQFEELFRFKRELQGEGGRNEALTFVRLLLTAADKAEEEGVPIFVALTMRSDFIGNCTELPGLAGAINKGLYLIPRMDRDERRAAIEGPVAVAGAGISPRLVRQILNDVGDNPDQLPIMQHALMRTWTFWEESHTADEPLDLRHYEAGGGMELALSNHADEAFAELDDRGRHIAEVLFKALTDRDNEGRGVRRPTSVAEVCALVQRGDEAPADVQEVAAVVDRFRRPGRTFVVASDAELTPKTVLDISHESLMRTWRKLIDWVEEEAQSARTYLRLSRAAEQYYAGTGSSWRDPELQLAINWKREVRPTAAWAERYDPAFDRAMVFLHHSEQEQQEEVAAREYQRRRQLRLVKGVALALLIAFLGMAAVGLVALQQKVKANDARAEAVTQQRLALDEKVRAEVARRAAEQAKDQALLAEEQAEAERRRAERNAQEAARSAQEAERKERLARSAEKAALVAEDKAQEQAVQARQAAQREAVERKRAEEEAQERERLRRLALAQSVAAQVPTLAQGSEQRELAALLAAQSYRLTLANGGNLRDPQIFNALHQAWSALNRGPEGQASQQILARFDDAARVLARIPGTEAVIAGGDDGSVRRLLLRDRGAGTATVLGIASGAVRGLAVNPAGDRLGVATAAGAVELWTLGDEGRKIQATAPAPVTGMTFAATGDGGLWTSHRDGSLRLWGETLQEEVILPASGTVATAVAVDGKAVALATDGGGILYWADALADRNPRSLASGGSFHSITFLPCAAVGSRGGSCLAVGTGGGEVEGVEIWNPTARTAPGRPVAGLRGHSARVTAVDYSRERQLIVTASLDGSLRLWQADHLDALPVVLDGHNGWVWGARFDADGDHLVSVSADRTARLWVVEPETLVDRICSTVGGSLSEERWGDYMQGIEYSAAAARCAPARGGAP